MSSLQDTTAVVTGASRGFGRAASHALCEAGATVVGIARSAEGLELVHKELGDAFVPVVGDATDPAVAEDLITAYRPRTLVLNAGALPAHHGPISTFDWEGFSRHWETDVRHAFHWTRSALTLPLDPGAAVVLVSSGAALRGSPMSGGYAGSKSTIKFIAAYAADESERAGLGIRFLSIFPGLTPGTGVGDRGVAAYAGLEGISVDEFVSRLAAAPDASDVGRAIRDLASTPGPLGGAFQVTVDGPVPV